MRYRDFISCFKILKKDSNHPPKNKNIKIKDRIALGSQSNLFIIEIKEKDYVIGATNQSIHLIDKL